MILVDVRVPSLNKVYDFNLEEYALVSVLIEEIVEMICQKEQCEMIGEIEEMLLCEEETQVVLPKHKNLEECGVHTGSRLLLV